MKDLQKTPDIRRGGECIRRPSANRCNLKKTCCIDNAKKSWAQSLFALTGQEENGRWDDKTKGMRGMKASDQNLVKEIQKKFDVNRYEKTKNWEPADWLCAISKRYNLAMYLGLPFSHESPMNERKVMEFPDDLKLEKITAIIENPTDTKNVIPIAFARDELKDLGVSDILYLADRIKQFVAELKQNYETEIDAETSDLDDMIFKLRKRDIKNKIRDGSSQYLVVNLEAPDDILRSKFDVWLEKSRNELKQAPAPANIQLNTNDMRQWCSQGLLPYIDLTMWAKINKTTLTQEVIGALIFPRIDDPINKLRSTKKNAFSLFQKQTMASLARECNIYSKLSTNS